MREPTTLEKTLSHLYQEHGLDRTIRVNSVLLTFERDSSGVFNLYVYNNSEYDTYEIEVDKTLAYPIKVKYIDKMTADKIVGCVMN